MKYFSFNDKTIRRARIRATIVTVLAILLFLGAYWVASNDALFGDAQTMGAYIVATKCIIGCIFIAIIYYTICMWIMPYSEFLWFRAGHDSQNLNHKALEVNLQLANALGSETIDDEARKCFLRFIFINRYKIKINSIFMYIEMMLMFFGISIGFFGHSIFSYFAFGGATLLIMLMQHFTARDCINGLSWSDSLDTAMAGGNTLSDKEMERFIKALEHMKETDTPNNHEEE